MKKTPIDPLPISDNCRGGRWFFQMRMRAMVILTIGAVTITPTRTSLALDQHERSRIQHVPDTWASNATEDSIFFHLASSTLDGAAAEAIERHAARLRATPELHVTLIAHTDDLGSSSLELAKGQERLDVISKRLESLKVSPGRVRTENHGGESRSVPKCLEEDCRRQSRRVDFLFHR